MQQVRAKFLTGRKKISNPLEIFLQPHINFPLSALYFQQIVLLKIQLASIIDKIYFRASRNILSSSTKCTFVKIGILTTKRSVICMLHSVENTIYLIFRHLKRLRNTEIQSYSPFHIWTALPRPQACVRTAGTVGFSMIP